MGVWVESYSTFFSFSAADPERMASSMASLAMAGFMGTFGSDLKDLDSGKTGGGGATGGAGGTGEGTKARGEAEVKEGDVETCVLLFSSGGAFLNISSSSAASDLVCQNKDVVHTLGLCSFLLPIVSLCI